MTSLETSSRFQKRGAIPSTAGFNPAHWLVAPPTNMGNVYYKRNFNDFLNEKRAYEGLADAIANL